MGKHDKLIKSGLKIVGDWNDTSAQYHDKFMVAKKNNIAWEKSTIKRLTALVEGEGADMKQVLDEIELSRNFLRQNEEELERAYQEHYKFVRGKPREGAVAVCEMLKLKKDTEEWDAVLEGLKRALIDNTKQFAATEGVWIKDVKPQIKLLNDRLDALEKIANGASKKNDAYFAQLLKSKDDFVKMGKDIEVNLKTSQAVDDLSAMEKPDFMQNNPKALTGKLQTYELRMTSIPQIRAQVEKNYRRIMKSVPENYLKQPMWARAVKSLEIEFQKILKMLDFAEKAFGAAAKKFKQKYPHI
ncbi:MAG: hypothetical protein KJ017_06210 [Alphaproteobacteria bacterium]|nr:hypothetical protein [Alphaproteobacteria bacterium]